MTNRNFKLGQTMYNYDFFNRSSVTNANGDPQLSTPDDDEVLQATLQHVVATFDPVDGRRIYVNGELVATDMAPGGTLDELGQLVRLRARQRGVEQPHVERRDPPRRDPQPRADAGADPAELRRRRRREILPAVRRRAPDEHQRQLRRVRGRAVRQLRLPVPPAVLHQPGRHGAAGRPQRPRACASA